MSETVRSILSPFPLTFAMNNKLFNPFSDDFLVSRQMGLSLKKKMKEMRSSELGRMKKKMRICEKLGIR